MRVLFQTAICFSVFCFTQPSKAQETGSSGAYIKITDANFRKSLMALPPFQFQGVAATSPQHLKIGKELFDVFRNDMETSGYFEQNKEYGDRCQ